jgi:archaellum biogenesis ATPase FlaH|tara:strand:+ start:1162 stop:2487 length:1326 start_codon:yes stop_codon:yes gene_type:complete
LEEQINDIFENSQVKRLGNSWHFELGNINLKIKVDNIKSYNYISGEITFSYLNPIFDKEHIHSSQIAINQLGGTNGRLTLMNHLRNIEPEIKEWDRILEYICVTVITGYREGEETVNLAETDMPIDKGNLITPIIPLGEPSLIFGEGGSGKSILSLWLANIVTQGVQTDWISAIKKNVLYIDYETNRSEYLVRNNKLANGMGLESPSAIYYRRTQEPMIAIAEIIRAEIQKRDIGFVVVDSAAMACGAEPESAKATTDYYKAIRSFGEDITVLTLAHTTKAETEKKTPFGSAFWTYYARSVWEIKRIDSDKSNQQNIGLYHRKVNNTQLHEPIGYQVKYLSNEINVNGFDITDSTTMNAEIPLIKRIYNYLREADNHKTVNDIVAELEIPEKKRGSVSAMMSRDIGIAKNIKHYGDGLYGVIGIDYDFIKEAELQKMPWDN